MVTYFGKREKLNCGQSILSFIDYIYGSPVAAPVEKMVRCWEATLSANDQDHWLSYF